MDSDETGQMLGDILDMMLNAEKIATEALREYTPIRTDRHVKGLEIFYESDQCLQEAVMNLGDAVSYIKNELNKLDGEP